MNQQQYFETVKSYKLLANKSLGQNFLTNPQIAEEIVFKANLAEDDKTLEIGCGLGSLSFFINNKCHADLIDVDERMVNFVLDNIKSERTNVLRQNVLKHDLSSYTKIIGNLPYYITSSILEHILTNATNAQTIVLMTQKEVYPKLLKNNPSPLSLLLNDVCAISTFYNVGRNNFTPVPHVDSVYFVLSPNENIKNPENKELYKLMCQMFLYRRKTILNCLTNYVKDKTKAADILNKLKIDSTLRPEQLDINFYKNLLKQLKSN